MRKPVYLRLTQEEFNRLRDVALAECRDPREHARYLVRVGLGLTDQEKHNGAGIRQDTPRAVVTHAG